MVKNIDYKDFQNLVIEIHRVNKGWHCFEISNRFLDNENKYLQSAYLRKKNMLQKELEEKYFNMIEIIEADETGFLSLLIKNEYKFDGYNDACHKI
jgi:hypothetical protein